MGLTEMCFIAYSKLAQISSYLLLARIFTEFKQDVLTLKTGDFFAGLLHTCIFQEINS